MVRPSALTSHVRAVLERAIRDAERRAADSRRKGHGVPEPWRGYQLGRTKEHTKHATELREAIAVLEREQDDVQHGGRP